MFFTRIVGYFGEDFISRGADVQGTGAREKVFKQSQIDKRNFNQLSQKEHFIKYFLCVLSLSLCH